MNADWTVVHVTSPEGWHEAHVLDPETGIVSRYVETPEIDENGLHIFQFVGLGADQ